MAEGWSGDPGGYFRPPLAGASTEGVAPRGGAGLSRDGMAQAQQATALSRAGVRHGEADRGDWRLPNCIGSRAVRINQVAFTRR